MWYQLRWQLRIVVYIGVLGGVLSSASVSLSALYSRYTIDFSKTQQWDEATYVFTKASPTLVANTYSLPLPPSSLSWQTQNELALLHTYESIRTSEVVETIKRERSLSGTSYAGQPYTTLVDPFTRPETYALVSASLNDLVIHVVQAKAQHNRVRPSFLDPTLTTAIAVPGHPAYPSGHATESYFLAFLFSALDPLHHDAYIESAFTITKNREIAGLHYPSDSDAGRTMAVWYFSELEKIPWYQEQLARAKTEW